MNVKDILKLRSGVLFLVVLGTVCFATPSAEAQILHYFTGASDGRGPLGPLVMDSAGNLYGTTSSGGNDCGTVFELVKNSDGTYTENVLYSFNCSSDGSGAMAPLAIDGAGNIYGTLYYGGPYGNGTVFELVNSSGTYTEQVLHNFGVLPDGFHPAAGLVMDSAGNLYGTTQYGGAHGLSNICPDGCGTVFEMVKNSGSGPAYGYHILHSFPGGLLDGFEPQSALFVDGAGNLYGTTSQGGVSAPFTGIVFELVNSGGTYSYQGLASFGNGTFGGLSPSTPVGGVVVDSSGNIYGTTASGGANGFGTVFELVNSSGTYPAASDIVLYSFGGPPSDGAEGVPYGGLIMDVSGNLYGTTSYGGSSTNCSNSAQGCGTVFELVNTSGTYTEKVLHSFGVSPSDGVTPFGGLIMDASGNLYGTANGGGPNSYGIVFLLPPKPSATTTTLTTSANPAIAGDSLSITATVTSAYGPATGLVTLAEGTTALGTQTLSSGQATWTVADATALGIGTNTLSAQYTPDSNYFGASTGTLSQTVSEMGVAVTSGSNTFSGNQTVNGVVTATSFVGDGSGLTGIVAQNANNANSANYATTAGAATTANFATALAGTPMQCGANTFSTGIMASGNANCLQPVSANLSDVGNLVFNMQGNIFTGGKQTLPASTTTYASFNIPNTGAVPSAPAMGDLWLTTAEPHLFFLDKTSTPQRLAFMSDVNSLDTSLLGGTNTFTGNNTFTQMINGNVSGNAGSATVAASAVTATTAITATTSANALDLGGVVASDYARLDIGNSFNGNQNIAGSETVSGNVSVSGNAATTGTVTIGSGGTPIKEHLSATFNPKFPALPPLTCSAQNFTLTGASDGDTLALGVPSARMNGGGTVVYFAWVSAANTVTIQVCNVFASPQKTAGTGNIRIDLWKH